MSLYQTYHIHKAYSVPEITDKHVRRLDREIWRPGGYAPDMSVLEVGCGTGLVLAYLARKGITRLTGIDQDPHLTPFIPAEVRDRFEAVDVQAFLNRIETNSTTFDRILMFDVLEHFDPEAGVALLARLAGLLSDGGRIHLKVPNAGSPWGQQFQYGDLTHKTAHTPESLRQQAAAAGLTCRYVYGQKLGSPARQRWEGLLNGLLDRILTSPPEIWEGNIFAVLAPLDSADPANS